MRYVSTIIFLVLLAADMNSGANKESGALLANFDETRTTPVDIESGHIFRIPENSSRIVRNGYGEGEDALLINTGESLEVILDQPETNQFISGEVIGNYFFVYAKTIFHWAKEATGVAGTLIDGKYGAPLEISVIHYNAKYSSLKDAENHKDGVTDLRFRFTANGEEDNDELTTFLENLAEVEKPGNVSIDMEDNSWYLNFKPSKCYVYPGEFHNKKCALVIIYETLLNTSISRSQFEKFLKITSNDGKELDTAQKIHKQDNRPVAYFDYDALISFSTTEYQFFSNLS